MKEIIGGGGGGDAWDRMTIERVEQILGRKFAERARRNGDTRLVGVIFGRPEVPLFKSEVLPNLKYWHHRSGELVDFFCAGLSAAWHDFSHTAFVDTVKHFESRTTWKYSGNTDLLLLNALFDAKTERTQLDWTAAVVLPLESVVAKGTFSSVSALVEQIVAFSTGNNRLDPASAFSDLLGGKLGARSVVRILLSLLPRQIGTEVEQALFLAIKDVSR